MKTIIEKHIKENYKAYLLLILIFFIGVVIGIIVLNNSTDSQKQEIQESH